MVFRGVVQPLLTGHPNESVDVPGQDSPVMLRAEESKRHGEPDVGHKETSDRPVGRKLTHELRKRQRTANPRGRFGAAARLLASARVGWSRVGPDKGRACSPAERLPRRDLRGQKG